MFYTYNSNNFATFVKSFTITYKITDLISKVCVLFSYLVYIASYKFQKFSFASDFLASIKCPVYTKIYITRNPVKFTKHLNYMIYYFVFYTIYINFN